MVDKWAENYRDQVLANTFRQIGELLIEAAKEITPIPEELDTHNSGPVMVDATGFHPCPKCKGIPVVFDYGKAWSVMCPQCDLVVYGEDKDSLMMGWNSLKLNKKGEVI